MTGCTETARPSTDEELDGFLLEFCQDPIVMLLEVSWQVLIAWWTCLVSIIRAVTHWKICILLWRHGPTGRANLCCRKKTVAATRFSGSSVLPVRTIVLLVSYDNSC